MTSPPFQRAWLATLAVVLANCASGAPGENDRLPVLRYRNGEQTLSAFAPISAATRHSIVKLNVNGATVALGAVVDTNGLAITKASELKSGRLTCWLATDEEVPAELVGTDETEDVALVRVHARDLKPIQWSTQPVAEGQWVITPGIAATPHAVGIVSALPRRIKPPRAFIGVQLDFGTSLPRIAEVMSGLGAAKAGLKAGDVIVAVDDGAVTNRDQVMEKLREYREGQDVRLRVRRSQVETNATVRMMTLGYSGARDPFDPRNASVSHRAEGFQQAIEHDSVLPPWLCGGPLVDLDGRAVGLNIARASRVTTYALPAKLVMRLVESLKTTASQSSHPAG